MQTYLLLPFGIFLSLIEWVVIVDVILSWLLLFGVQIIIPFFRNILDPLYRRMGKIIPVEFFGLNFAPIIVLLFIDACKFTLVILDPGLALYFPSFFVWK